jgi:hypothetical protein
MSQFTVVSDVEILGEVRPAGSVVDILPEDAQPFVEAGSLTPVVAPSENPPKIYRVAVDGLEIKGEKYPKDMSLNFLSDEEAAPLVADGSIQFIEDPSPNAVTPPFTPPTENNSVPEAIADSPKFDDNASTEAPAPAVEEVDNKWNHDLSDKFNGKRPMEGG